MDKKMTGPQRSTRPRSALNIKFLRDDSEGVRNVRTSWRERVRSIQGPTSAANNRKRPPSAADQGKALEDPFDLGQISRDWSTHDIRVCVNGKPSDSPESAELTRSFARWKRTGSLQAEDDDEESLLEEVLGLEDLLLADEAWQKKVPLCWDDLDGSTSTPHSPGKSRTNPLKKPQEPSEAADLEGTEEDVKHPSQAPTPHVASRHKESSLSVDIMVTWGDQCLLPWQPHYTPHSSTDATKHPTNTVVRMSSISPHLEVGGRCVGSQKHSFGYQLVQNILSRSKGAGRLIGVTKRGHLDDLLCLWLRFPNSGDKVQPGKLEACSFEVYLSENPNGKSSTRVFKKLALRKVVHNLFVLKFHLVTSLPWITDAGQLQGKCLGVSLYISKPQKFEGLVLSEWVTLTPSPHTPLSPTRADQASPQHTQHQPQTNHVCSLEQDEDKMMFALNNAALDTASQQAQEFILSFYCNPYQVNTREQEREQRDSSGRWFHNSRAKRDPKPYTNLVQQHLGKFLDKSSIGKAAASGSQPHIQVCSHPSMSASKQKRKGKQRPTPHVTVPTGEALHGTSVGGGVSCQRFGVRRNSIAGQKPDTIEEEVTTSWRATSTVAMPTTDCFRI